MKAIKVVKITSILLLVSLIFIILGGVFYCFSVTNGVKLDKTKLTIKTNNRISIFDNYGSSIGSFSNDNDYVPFEKISKDTINAFIAVEDKRFYKHNGIDVIRIGSSLINNVKAGYFKEGGSTITQQLAKNLLLTQEKTIDRKLKEIKLALEIERNYTKEEIITLYLNSIYFGHSLYGISQATRRLFNKSPNELTLAESAMLAGITKNPLKNSPLNSIENASNRRDLILNLMHEQGYIDSSRLKTALNESYTIPEINDKTTANNLYNLSVIRECSNILNKHESEIVSGGYSVYTYYDKNLQELLDKVCSTSDLSPNDAERLFLLCDNKTRGIVAYKSTLNVSATDFRRQPASTIKPIVSYAPAIEHLKLLPCSPILDERYDFSGYSPKNHKNQYLGWTDLRESLITSSNATSLKLLAEVGLKRALNTATKLGLSFDISDGYASALGGLTYGSTPVELVSAYSTFANNGSHKQATFIKYIYDEHGTLIYSNENINEKQVISEETAYFINNMLKECTKRGTAKKLNQLSFDIASKTGTNGTELGNYDAWNLSYTTDYTLCSWYGSNDYSKTVDLSISGGTYPTLAAKHVFSSLNTPKSFEIPSSIEQLPIDTYVQRNNHLLRLANAHTPNEYRKLEPISTKNLPTVSNYFDHALPEIFEVVLGDNEVFITVSGSDKFRYVIKNSQEDVLYTIEKGLGVTEIVLPMPSALWELYSVTALTEEGVIVKKSNPLAILTW